MTIVLVMGASLGNFVTIVLVMGVWAIFEVLVMGVWAIFVVLVMIATLSNFCGASVRHGCIHNFFGSNASQGCHSGQFLWL